MRCRRWPPRRTPLPPRQALLSQAQALAQQLNGYSAQISQYGNNLEQQIHSDVSQINTLAGSIATLNSQIARIWPARGQPPNQLLDQRDQLIDQLSQYVSVSTATRADGMLDVYIGSGQALSQRRQRPAADDPAQSVQRLGHADRR